MANEAVFNEVLAITIDTSKFAQQMKEVEKIYTASLSNLPSLGEVGNNAAIAELEKSMLKLRLAFGELGNGITEDIAILANQNAAMGSAEAATTKYTTAVEEGSAAERKRFQEIEKAEAELRKYIGTIDAARTAEERRNSSASGRVGEGVQFGPQTRDAAESDFRKNAALQSAALKENELRAKEAGGGFSQFASGVASSIGTMAEFAVAAAAISAVIAILALPIKALKDGFDYLGSLQERASQLKLALSTVETFDATNPTNNLKLMGQEADRLARKIEDLAVTLNIKADVAQHAFEKFAEFGGRNLNGSNNQTAEASTLLTGALQAQGPIQARATFTELSKLVEGTLTETNKLPAALGLSAEQLNAMSKGARDTHDFLEQLKAAVPGLEERVASANERFLSLQGTVELLVKRFEGAFAQDTFDAFTKGLQEVLKYVSDNRAAIEGLGRALGAVTADGIKTLFELFTGPLGKVLIGALRATAEDFLGIVTALNLAGNAAVGIGRSVAFAYSLVTGSAKEQQDAFDKLTSTAVEQAKILADSKEAALAILGFAKGQTPQGEVANTSTGLFHDKDKKEGLGDLNSSFREELDETKAKYEKTTHEIEELVSRKKISHGQAAEQIKANLRSEGDAIDGLVAKYKALAKAASDASGEGNEGKLDKFNKGLDTTRVQFGRTAQNQGAALDRASASETVSKAKDEYNEYIRVAKEAAKELTTIAEEEYKDGRLTATQLADAKISNAERARTLTRQQLVAEQGDLGIYTLEYQQVTEKIADLDRSRTNIDRENSNLRKIAAEQDIATARALAIAKAQIRIAEDEEAAAALKAAGQHNAARLADKQTLSDKIALVQIELQHARSLQEEAIASGKTAENIEKLADATRRLQIEQQKLETEKILAVASGVKNPALQSNERRSAADNDIKQAQQAAQVASDAFNKAARRSGESLDDWNNRLKRLQANSEAAAQSLLDVEAGAKKFASADNGGQGGFSKVVDQFKESFLGQDFQQAWDDATTKVDKMGAAAGGIANAFTSVVSSIEGAAQAYKKGGIAGAAGSLLSSGPLSDALSAIPVVGAFVKPFGQVLSAVSGLFAKNIQNIVQDINTRIADINQKAQTGKITLAEQIKELQAEKQSAIDQLGGSKKKGAKGELDSILKSLNAEIDQLQKQQLQIITNFNQIVKAASLGTSVYSDWYNQWVQINAQAKQYVDAGGSAVIAAQFLNQQLAAQRLQLQDQLAQGDQTAIADALQLNTLIQQRTQALKDEAATEFGLLNADSQERRVSNAVQVGTELQKQRGLFAQQLSDLNNQISLEQQKVAVEGQIFDINKSIAQLQIDSNALTIRSLNEQLAKYKDMQKIIAATNGLVFGPGSIPTAAGATLPIPGEPTVNGPVVGTVNITVQGSVNEGNATTLAMEMARQIRSGASGF